METRRLPNAHLALVEQTKIRGYLLNPSTSLRRQQSTVLCGIRLHHGYLGDIGRCPEGARRPNEVVRMKETGFGPRYEIEGALETPDGRRPRVRTVWQVDQGQIAPRLITAYPLETIHDS